MTNGHGERRSQNGSPLRCENSCQACGSITSRWLAIKRNRVVTEVGPRRTMPSGGLIAMGNARNLARDLRAGLFGLTFRQARYPVRPGAGMRLWSPSATYMRSRWHFFATPDGLRGNRQERRGRPVWTFEERLLSRACVCFVRDEPRRERCAPTACGLRRRMPSSISSQSPKMAGRLHAQLPDSIPSWRSFPAAAKARTRTARFLLEVTRELAVRRSPIGGILSIAQGTRSEPFCR